MSATTAITLAVGAINTDKISIYIPLHVYTVSVTPQLVSTLTLGTCTSSAATTKIQVIVIEITGRVVANIELTVGEDYLINEGTFSQL
jgi:hypothetical protein